MIYDMTSVREIKDRLLRVIDKDGSVLNLPAVMDIVVVLENLTITREELEETRIGKYINDVRKAAKDQSLQKRAKKLIKTWHQMVLNSPQVPKNISSQPGNEPSSLKRQTASSMSLVSMNDKRTPPATSLNGDAKLSSNTRKKETVTDNANFNKKQSKSKPNVKMRPSLPKPKSTPSLVDSAKSSFTCKPNGLKMTFMTLPSSTSKQSSSQSSYKEEKERLKRKRRTDSPEVPISNRTSECDKSDSLKQQTFLKKVTNSKTNFISDKNNVHNFSESSRTETRKKLLTLDKKTFSPKVLEPDKKTTVDDVMVKSGDLSNSILSPTFSHSIGGEAAGVEGCRTNDGLWHTWSDSFVLKRTSVETLNTETPDEPDVLSILPYVELE